MHYLIYFVSGSIAPFLLIGSAPAIKKDIHIHPLKDVKAVSASSPLGAVVLDITAVADVASSSLEFVLGLDNQGITEVGILNPLKALQLQFATINDRQIIVPTSPPEALINTREKMPYPALIKFREIVRDGTISHEDLQVIKLAPGGLTKIKFSCSQFVLQKIRAALQPEGSRSAKVRVTLSLTSFEGSDSSRVVVSPWIPFEVADPK